MAREAKPYAHQRAADVLLRTELMVLALLMASTACSKGGGASVAALPAIMLEAADDDASNSGGSPARRAARDSIRQVLVAEEKCGTGVGRLSWRPELRDYLFRDESYIGGTFPAGTAAIFHEIQKLETEYLKELQEFPQLLATNMAQAGVPAGQSSSLASNLASAFAAEREPIVKAVEAHRKFIDAAAELYELMASQPDSIKAMREGLQFSDSRLGDRYSEQVGIVNNAHDEAEASLRALDADQRKSLHWMRLKRPTPLPSP